MEQNQLDTQQTTKEEKVPVFGSWKGWYTFTVLFLVALIIFFYTVTALFND